jgi:glycosyltransferase involved in cell wall biosynthesis
MMTFTYSRLVRSLLYIFWKFLLTNATHIRSVSVYISTFVNKFNISSSKVTVIPNKEVLGTFAFNPSQEEIKKLGEDIGLVKAEGKIVVLSNARLMKVKNYEKMLQAFYIAYQKNENIEYWKIGNGPLLADLKKIVQDLKIESSVKFLGYFSHSQLRIIYKMSDIFLLASFYEGQPRVIVEAMLSELPIICANYGQMCEIVKDQEDGIWVDPQNINEIADAIYKLSINNEMQRKLSRHVNFDANQYSYESVNAKEKILFQSVIKNSKVVMN